MIRVLGQAYGFRVFCFWQPASVYGHKLLHPFETRMAGNDPSLPPFRTLNIVYQHAERRAATDRIFVFLGHIFDSVKEPVFIDWAHLAPQGNELVAKSVAKTVEQNLRLDPVGGIARTEP